MHKTIAIYLSFALSTGCMTTARGPLQAYEDPPPRSHVAVGESSEATGLNSAGEGPTDITQVGHTANAPNRKLSRAEKFGRSVEKRAKETYSAVLQGTVLVATGVCLIGLAALAGSSDD